VIAVLAEHGVVGPRADAIATLCDLYGPPTLLRRAVAVLGQAADRSHGLAELQAVVEGLANGPHADVCSRITVDLGEVRGFDYYTGLRVRVWAPGIHRPIVRGGRYDHLLARYGEPRPATGFAIDLDALEAALGDTGRESTQRAGHIVGLAPGCADAEGRRRAAALAAARREAGERAWVQIAPIAGPEAGSAAGAAELALARARSVAEAADADALSWIEPDGQGGLRVVHSTRTAAGWRTIAPESEEP